MSVLSTFYSHPGAPSERLFSKRNERESTLLASRNLRTSAVDGAYFMGDDAGVRVAVGPILKPSLVRFMDATGRVGDYYTLKGLESPDARVYTTRFNPRDDGSLQVRLTRNDKRFELDPWVY